MKIVIIDYGAGNIANVYHALKEPGAKASFPPIPWSLQTRMPSSFRAWAPWERHEPPH